MIVVAAPKIVPIDGQPGWWAVCLGGGTYAVSEEGICTCPSFERPWDPLWTAPPGHDCKHIRALAEYLDRQRECPLCHGHGVIHLRESYPGLSSLPCAACEGSGLRCDP